VIKLIFNNHHDLKIIIMNQIGNYIIIKTIGATTSCTVYKAIDPNQQTVVLKVVSLKKFRESELTILKALKGVAGAVQYLDHFTHNQECVIVFQEFKGTELYQLIENELLSLDEIQAVFKNICQVMFNIHQLGIVHRDLKLEHILVSSDREKIVILDWGLAFFPEQTLNRASCGSLYYASPELLEETPEYIGPEVDVWALGCIYYTMLTGIMAFDAPRNCEIFAKIRGCVVNWSPRGLTPEAANILRKIFVTKERISLANLIAELDNSVNKIPYQLLTENSVENYETWEAAHQAALKQGLKKFHVFPAEIKGRLFGP
jgi:serine/threonine protein kinase